MSDSKAAWDSAGSSFGDNVVGDTTTPCPLARGGALVSGGSAAEQKKLDELVEKIRKSGPKGKAFIESLEKGPTKTACSSQKARSRKTVRSST
jgi:hypothetical protein